MRINGRWHEAMHMPKHPSLDEKVKWHIMHHYMCQCREIPPTVTKALKKRKIVV